MGILVVNLFPTELISAATVIALASVSFQGQDSSTKKNPTIWLVWWLPLIPAGQRDRKGLQRRSGTKNDQKGRETHQ